MDILTTVLTVGSLLLYGFIYLMTRNGCISLLGPIGLTFILGGVWNLVVGKGVGWSQIGIRVFGVLIVVGVLRRYTDRGKVSGGQVQKPWRRLQEPFS